jgi:hypothetical protein
MNKVFTLLLLPLFAVFAQSCKKDSSAKNEKADSNRIYLVSKITFHYPENLNRVEEYTYDDKRRITKSRTENYWATPRGQWETFTYEYDANNRLIKALVIDNANTVVSARLFTYNANKTASESVHEVTENGVRAFVYPVSLDANGRVIFVGTRFGVLYDDKGHFIYFGAPEWMDIWNSTVQYDDKKNPFYNVVGLNPNFNYLVELYPIQTVNNLLTINNSGHKEMTYNIDDYPVKSTYTATDGSKTVVEYEYIIK